MSGPDAGHPLHGMGGPDDQDQGTDVPGIEREWGANLRAHQVGNGAWPHRAQAGFSRSVGVSRAVQDP